MTIHPLMLTRILIDTVQARDDDGVPSYLGQAVLVGHLPLSAMVTARLGVATAPLLARNPPSLESAGLSMDMVAWPLARKGLAALFPTTTIKIGRDRSCDLVLPDMQVSQVHATITLGPDTATITDQSRSNHTLVNGLPLHGERPLSDGDRITLGGVEVTHLTGARLLAMLRSGQ